jgi:ribonucleotide reductase class II
MSPVKPKFEFTYVRKRDGRIVPFDRSRIFKAIEKAMRASGEGNGQFTEEVTEAVIKALIKKYMVNGIIPKDAIPNIEEIQDIVETQLILLDYPKAAKAYILYRQQRAQLREKRREIPEHVKKLATESKKYFRNSLGEFVYYRSYSRWIENEGRRETWVETVQRFMDYMKQKLGKKLRPKEYREIQQAILKQEVMPSMRLLWSAGAACEATNVAAYNCAFIAPRNLKDLTEIMYISMCGAGVGFSVEHQNVHAFPQIKKQTGKVLPVHVIEDSKEGWCAAFYAGLSAWFSGKDINFDFSKIRPEGARLKTMGGRTSGPRPLQELLNFARKKILARQGSRLSTLDIHDIICKIGEVVVVGGVRRSALISLSDLDDPLMRFAKQGQFYITEPQRAMANNSAVYDVKPTASEFMEEWLALAKSGTGERGIFNRGSLEKQLPPRRWKVFKKHAATCGTNPCVTKNIWVMTSKGAKQVKDLIDAPFEAMVNGKKYLSDGFFKTGEKDVFEIKTKRGFSFCATDNHKVLVADYKSRKIQKNVWKEVKDLKIGDKLVLHNHREISWDGRGSESEGWLLGSLFGDGNIEKNGKANLDYWGITQSAITNRALLLMHSAVGARSDSVGHVSKTGYGRVQSVPLGKLAISYGLSYGNKVVTDNIEEASSEFYKGFLRGWFDAAGSVQGSQKKGVSVRLSSSNLSNLKRAQRMLARLGIIGTIYENRQQPDYRLLSNGRGGMKEYLCNADHELVISGENIKVFRERINFSDPDKSYKLENMLNTYKRKLNQELFISEIIEISYGGKEEVFDCNVFNINAFDGNGLYLHNCGEIVLRSKQFCNLSEVVARPEDTEKTLLRKIRLAAILGTYQSTLTNFPYLSPAWKKNCEEERLLGVSITGQWDCPLLYKDGLFRQLKEKAIAVNQEYAKRFGINASTCVTCVKPSGTVSQLVDASSGLHPRHAKYYLRRVRISATDSLFHMLRDQKIPYYPEVGQAEGTAATYVVEFPIKAPERAVTLDQVSAIDQLEYWKKVKINFTEHNPSVTISVGSDEWVKVANWLYENWDILGGLSFLPRSEYVYALAPYEAIDEKTYEEKVKNFPEIDFSQILLYEKDDETEGAKELACVGGTCEI